jgi:membrane-associated phospholipid phosphatase
MNILKPLLISTLTVIALQDMCIATAFQPTPQPSPPTPTVTELPATFTREFIDTAGDYVNYWTLPFRWKADEWNTFWMVCGITGGLLVIDGPLFSYTEPRNVDTFNKISDPIKQIGNWKNPAIAVGGIYVASFILEDQKLHRASRIATKSLIFQSLVNQGMKNIIYRTIEENPFDFRLFPPEWMVPSDGGFPSGHASNMWAVLSSYAMAYEDDPVIPTVCYSLAGIGSLALVTNDNHWVSDIFLGAALGYYTAAYIRDIDDKRASYVIVPIVSPQAIGLSIVSM